ncbi:hypothetical protein LZ30DRAFT_444858 [Colletotrichum cereale]|nr:hypothetical protein LZ30DRAFT_444858 [Colletotrichum cereale]
MLDLTELDPPGHPEGCASVTGRSSREQPVGIHQDRAGLIWSDLVSHACFGEIGRPGSRSTNNERGGRGGKGQKGNPPSEGDERVPRRPKADIHGTVKQSKAKQSKAKQSKANHTTNRFRWRLQHKTPRGCPPKHLPFCVLAAVSKPHGMKTRCIPTAHLHRP